MRRTVARRKRKKAVRHTRWTADKDNCMSRFYHSLASSCHSGGVYMVTFLNMSQFAVGNRTINVMRPFLY